VAYTYYSTTDCSGTAYFFVGELVGGPFAKNLTCVPAGCSTNSLLGIAKSCNIACITGTLPTLPVGMIGYQNWVGSTNCSGNPPLIYGSISSQCTNVSSSKFSDALVMACEGTSVILNDYENTQSCVGIPITDTLLNSCTLVGGGSYVSLGCNGPPLPKPGTYELFSYYDSVTCGGAPVIVTATAVETCAPTACTIIDLVGTTSGLQVTCFTSVPSLPSNMIGVGRWYDVSCTGNPDKIIGTTSACSNFSLPGATLSVYLQCNGFGSLSFGEFFNENCTGSASNITSNCSNTPYGTFKQLGCDGARLDSLFALATMCLVLFTMI